MGKHPPRYEKALEIFRTHTGMMRTADALRAGINPATLYGLRDAGLIDRIARGLYRLAEAEDLSAPDIATVMAKVPGAVLCLISALDWHGLTTQIPHQVHITMLQGSHKPQLDWPPLRVTYMQDPCFSAGIETHTVDGVELRIYSAEKTIVDCFKFRNKIGLDVALEALRMYRARGVIRTEALYKFARLCRVRPVMRPYLEALL